MLNRNSISNGNYVETVCELLVETSVKDASIEDLQVPILPEKVNKIAFIGDTGCRINMVFQQECNSVDSWPLKKT